MDTQLDDLKSKVGGGTPTRLSIYERPDVKKASDSAGGGDMPNILSAKVALDAWKAENIGLRPKVAKWNECDTIIFTELSKMIAGAQAPERAPARQVALQEPADRGELREKQQPGRNPFSQAGARP